MSSDDKTDLTGSQPLASLTPDVERTVRSPGLARYLVRAWTTWQRIHLGKIVLFVASLFLFVLAITLMKEGSRGLAPLVRNRFNVTGMTDALGFGWLFAYTIMSGSPVAATALTLFDVGILDNQSAFAMIVGSRLGASFIVLFIGFVYVLRGRNRAASLDMGLLSLSVTATTYLPGLFLGVGLLRAETLAGVHLGSGAVLTAITERVFGPITGWIFGLLPLWAIFVVGLGIIMASFSLFDHCLPTMTIKESQLGRTARLVYRPGVMFILGGLVTLVSMSVSISLSLLVPLSNRGFIRRENVVPYIMGANITTFLDTLLAAVLLDNSSAFTIVLVAMLTNALVSILILLTVYGRYQRAMLRLVSWVTVSNRNLAISMALIFIVPLLLVCF